jgi:phosphotransferase system enzyme I (PtsI)
MSGAAAERVYEGLGVAPGIAIGPAYVVEPGMAQVPEYPIPRAGIDGEIARFDAAVEQSRQQIQRLQRKAAELSGAAGEELGYLLQAYQQMLSGSRLIRGVEAHIRDAEINAEAAINAELRLIGRDFAALTDPYIAARMADIRDVAARLLRNLQPSEHTGLGELPAGAVLIAEELSPADTAAIDPARVGGFATVFGGPESHTAIMARSLGLPAVLGVAGLINRVRGGQTVIVDGAHGRVVVDPSAATVAAYEARRTALRAEERGLERLRRLPAETRDGARIGLQANVELPSELALARRVGAEGIGLLRSEFAYMNRDTLPDEEEQLDGLAALVRGMRGRPVTIRTLDVGGEKLAHALDVHFADTDNPALGLRAIRLSLQQRPLFETQLAAILRAGAIGPVRILLPMVTSVGEVRQAKAAVARVARRLRRRGVTIADPLPPVGVMIETPAAALAADGLAFAADFFSIGTNDLTMYTLAIDRANEQVAHLYDPLHPAVLRLIQFATEAALRARIDVALCGEMAGDPRYTALLLGLGLRDLSMAAPSLPRIKRRVRGLDLAAAVRTTQAIMQQSDPGRISALLDDFNTLA